MTAELTKHLFTVHSCNEEDVPIDVPTGDGQFFTAKAPGVVVELISDSHSTVTLKYRAADIEAEKAFYVKGFKVCATFTAVEEEAE